MDREIEFDGQINLSKNMTHIKDILMDGLTDIQIDILMDRQINGQIDRQINVQIDKSLMDRQIEFDGKINM